MFSKGLSKVVIVQERVNSLTNNRILNQSEIKDFANNKINVIQKLNFVLGRVENIVGKGENAGYQHFLLFPQCFEKLSFSGSLKVGIVWKRVNYLSFHLFNMTKSPNMGFCRTVKKIVCTVMGQSRERGKNCSLTTLNELTNFSFPFQLDIEEGALLCGVLLLKFGCSF